jgi:hypothetical protein
MTEKKKMEKDKLRATVPRKILPYWKALTSNWSVVDSSVGRALSFSHEGPWFKSCRGHLFASLLNVI